MQEEFKAHVIMLIFRGFSLYNQRQTAVLKKAVLQTSPRTIDASPKVRVLEPKGFNGARSSKELENFLWDME